MSQVIKINFDDSSKVFEINYFGIIYKAKLVDIYRESFISTTKVNFQIMHVRFEIREDTDTVNEYKKLAYLGL